MSVATHAIKNREILKRSQRSLATTALYGRAAFGVMAIAAAISSPAQAAPTGGVVAAGGATITNTVVNATHTNVTVNQSTHHAVIDWTGFNTNSGEIVTFIQKNGALSDNSAIALN